MSTLPATTTSREQKQNTTRRLLAGLWLIWFILLPVPFALSLITENSHWLHYIWTSTFVLSAAAWVHAASSRTGTLTKFYKLIALGITTGALADIYGTQLTKHFSIEPLLITIPLFALGHLFYIIGTLNAAHRLHLTHQPKWRTALLISTSGVAAVGFTLWKTLVHSSETLPFTHLPLAGYTGILAVAAAVMLTISILAPRFCIIAIGGLLFLASDGLLAVKIFQDNPGHIGDLCWIVYGIGQMLITYGTVYVSKTSAQ